ncbi:TetR/AcrR family transcriptional regulator [Streptomyces sp. NPDC002550]
MALTLFIEQGYDATTMEHIAERAEVGSTTFYRYFPSKDLLILDRFTRFTDLGTLVRERPVEEPLNAVLGAAIHASLDGINDKGGRLTVLRRILDGAPVPRARLLDLMAQSQGGLESAIAERMERPVGDIQVALTAHMAFAVYQIAAETWWAGDHHASSSAVVEEVLGTISGLELVIPAPPAGHCRQLRLKPLCRRSRPPHPDGRRMATGWARRAAKAPRGQRRCGP